MSVWLSMCFMKDSIQQKWRPDFQNSFWTVQSLIRPQTDNQGANFMKWDPWQMHHIAADQQCLHMTNWINCWTKCFAAPLNQCEGYHGKPMQPMVWLTKLYVINWNRTHTEFQPCMNWSRWIMLNVLNTVTGSTLSYRKMSMFWTTHYTLTRHGFICQAT